MGKLFGKVKRGLRARKSKLKLADPDQRESSTDTQKLRVTRSRTRSKTPTSTMEEDEDDMYAPEEEVQQPKVEPVAEAPAVKDETMEDEDAEEDGEESDEDEDSDIEIVTEAKPGVKPEQPPSNQRLPSLRSAEGTSFKPDSPAPGPKPTLSPAIKVDPQGKPSEPQRPGSSYPAIRSSTIDIEAKPTHEPSGKPITEVDMDADFGEDDKPWRRPGQDQTDYFNYGFDEFTWSSYCLKQDTLRKEAKDQKKQLEDMHNFMGMGGAPAPAAPVPMGGMGIGGPQDMPPEMQQAMQQMISSGIDPTQMDFNQFVQMMGQGGQPGMGGGYGQPGNQQQMGGYGYGGGGHGGHGGHGGRSGRGRGRW